MGSELVLARRLGTGTDPGDIRVFPTLGTGYGGALPLLSLFGLAGLVGLLGDFLLAFRERSLSVGQSVGLLS